MVGASTGAGIPARASGSSVAASPPISLERRAAKLASRRVFSARGDGAGLRSIAIVITAPTSRVYGDPYFAALLRSINNALAERSLLPVIIAPQTRAELSLAGDHLLSGQFHGVILANLDGGSVLPDRLRDAGVPVVARGTPGRSVAVSYVDSDNRHGAQVAVDHLIALGRRRIAVISGLLDQTDAVDRLNGYRDALQAAGIALDPTFEEVADYLPDRAHMSMERLLLNHPDVDAVFAASDLMAASAIDVLRQAGRRVPEDVAVIGFDDSLTALTTVPQLSSIRQHIDAIGRETVELLVQEMRTPSEEPRRVIFNTELVVRGSTVSESAGPGTAAR
jgi:DNA-binding LacI/PurR family transcriptional regulator